MEQPYFDWRVSLSRRERQVLECLIGLGQASAGELQKRMPESVSYSAVRAVLRVLEERGLIAHEMDGPRYIYKPTLPKEKAKTSLLKQILHTFFNGSPEQMVASLLEAKDVKTSPAELDKLATLIEQARKQKKP